MTTHYVLLRSLARLFLLVFLTGALTLASCKKWVGRKAAESKAAEQAAVETPVAKAPAQAAPAAAEQKAAAATETTAPSKATTVDQTAQVIVLLYHRFEKPKNAKDVMAVEPTVFEQQMQELKDKGVVPISMPDFLAWKRGEKSIPPKSALITIDDGFKSAYEVAWPVLKKFGYPFTMFIYTDFVKGQPKAGGQSLSWEQLEEMRDGGVAIESHTVSHADLRHLPKGAKVQPYEAWLENEVAASKKMIEEKLGIKVSALAFPYGNHNAKVVAASKQAGYDALFTTYGQKITYATSMDGLGRYSIEPNTPGVFQAAVNFTGSAGGSGATTPPAASVSLVTEPAAGSTVANATPLIKADLNPMGAIDPASVEMRIAGIGQVPAKYDAATKTVTYQMTQKIRDKSCTVIISGKVAGKKVESRWSFNFDTKGGAAGTAPAAEPALPKKNP